MRQNNPLFHSCIDFDSPSQGYDSKYEKKEEGYKYIDGEDPEEVAAGSAEYTTLNIIDALSKFPKLHALNISRGAPLNGR